MAPCTICFTLQFAGSVLLSQHKDYLWELMSQWQIRQCEEHCVMSTSTDSVQEENHCLQNSTKLRDIKLSFAKEH